MFKLKLRSFLLKSMTALLCLISFSADAVGSFSEIKVCGVMHGISKEDSEPQRMYALISEGAALNEALGTKSLEEGDLYMLATDIYGSFRLFELPENFSWSDGRALQMNDQNSIRWTVTKGWSQCY